MNYIDITTSNKVFYTNVQYRKNDKSNNYIDGIHRALVNELSDAVINDIKSNLGDGSHTSVSDDASILLTSNINVGIGLQALNNDIAEATLRRALLYCPVDTGRLRSSGRIEHINNKPVVIFGDDTVNYAWFVHEFTWRNINRTKNPYATSKWLEIAYNEILREFKII